jgi:hypothetical protein
MPSGFRARYDQKCLVVSVYSTRYSCPILMKPAISRRFFKKYSHNRPVGAELFHADRRTDMKNLIVIFAILRTHVKIVAFSKDAWYFNDAVSTVLFRYISVQIEWL